MANKMVLNCEKKFHFILSKTYLPIFDEIQKELGFLDYSSGDEKYTSRGKIRKNI